LRIRTLLGKDTTVGLSAEAVSLAAELNKRLGEGSVILASDMRVARRYTSGSLSLDVALGGGWPGNQWAEVLGMESHGKTAIVLKTIAANQALDPDFSTLWIAAEHYDVDQAAALGVDNTRVVVVPTQEMEVAYETMLQYAKARAVDCVVLDSYPALIPKEEEEKAMDEAVMALGARLTGKFFRKAGAATRRSLILQERPMLGFIINQYRDKIGAFAAHGTPRTSPGGNAKNYAFYVRVEVNRDEWIEQATPGKGRIKVGQKIKVRTIKNKSAAPQQVAYLDFYFRAAPVLGFERGDYDLTKELVAMAVVYDVITRGGATFRFADHKWTGKEAMFAAIRKNDALCNEIAGRVRDVALDPLRMKGVTETDLSSADTVGVRTIHRRHREVA
jgi:recombination protein RecA